MNKKSQAARVNAICEYLAGIGHAVSNVQGYEILARAHGFKNKHVLASSGETSSKLAVPSLVPVPLVVEVAGKQVPVRAAEASPLSFAEMVALDWQFNFVIAVPLATLEGNIDGLNEFASKSITGNEYALESLQFTHIPSVIYGEGWVAYQVCAYVSAPKDWFEEAQAAIDAQFYGDLKELSDSLVPGARLTVRLEANAAAGDVGVISYLAGLAAVAGSAPADLLRDYALGCGANNDAVNASSQLTVFEVRSADMSDQVLGAFVLGDLKYATKTAPRTWSFSVGRGPRLELRFG